MKISPIIYAKINNRNHSTVKHQHTKKTSESFQSYVTSPRLNCEYYNALFNIKPLSFGNIEHKSISSTKPIYTPCCTYDDVEEFSEQFANKINSQIQNPSLEDVEKLLSNIKLKTGADEKLIKEVVFRLSQFSTFKSILFLENELKKRCEYIPHSLSSKIFDETNLSSVFGYLAIKFNLKNKGIPVVFVDDHSIKQYETGEVVPYYDSKIHILDGFDVLTKDGTYRGANFLAGTGHLEALAIDVIEQIQEGRDIEDIMHESLEKRITDFANSKNPQLYKNFRAQVIKKPMPANITSNDILNNLLENTLDSDYVKERIREKAKYHTPWHKLKGYGEYYEKTKEMETSLMKYLDGFAFAFSAHSLSEIMDKMKSKMDEIEQNTGRKNLYYCPNTEKSYNLISYMFMKNSGTDYERVKHRVSYKDTKGKNTVIFDDSTISGKSQEGSINDLEWELYSGEYDSTNPILVLNENLYYATVAAGQSIKDKSVAFVEIPDMIDLYGFFCYNKKDKTIEEIKEIAKKSNLDLDDIKILMEILGCSYRDSKTAIAFPYILPDNNSDFASDILDPLLIDSTSDSKNN